MGLFEANRKPFGLQNAPSTFQRLMTCCFGDLNFTHLLIYLDDVIIFYFHSVIIVFDRLREHGLKLKPSKCQLVRQEVNYKEGDTIDQNYCFYSTKHRHLMFRTTANDQSCSVFSPISINPVCRESVFCNSRQALGDHFIISPSSTLNNFKGPYSTWLKGHVSHLYAID